MPIPDIRPVYNSPWQDGRHGALRVSAIPPAIEIAGFLAEVMSSTPD